MDGSNPAESLPHSVPDENMPGTLASRRRSTRLQPLIIKAESAPDPWSLANEKDQRSRELRDIDQGRQSLGSEASGPTILQSSSSVQQGWSADDLAEDLERKARRKDSAGRKSPSPSTFKDLAVGNLIKLRLLPVMKTLITSTETRDLEEALEKAEAILEYAVTENASPALQGRCCYYVGVAMHLGGRGDAFKYFVAALDAKGIYDEGRQARQWINHYENLAELSPKRIAITDQRVSWSGSIAGYLKNDKHANNTNAGPKALLAGRTRKAAKTSKVLQGPPSDGGGVQVTTPVSQRSTLDLSNGAEEEHSSIDSGHFRSEGINHDAESSIAGGGEPIPSFSTWTGSASDKTIEPTPSRRDTVGGSHSPISSSSSSSSSSHHARHKSSVFNTAVLDPEVVVGQESRRLRRQKLSSASKTESIPNKLEELSLSKVDTSSSIMKRYEDLSISPMTRSDEHATERGPQGEEFSPAAQSVKHI